MFKVNNQNIRKRQRRCSGVFIVKFEHISHLFSVSVVDFEQINVSWEMLVYENLINPFHKYQNVEKISHDLLKCDQWT